MGVKLYGRGVSHGYGCCYEALVASVIIQGGSNGLDFSAMWIEVSELGGGFMDKDFVPGTSKGVPLKSNFLKRQAWAEIWVWHR